MDIYSIPKQEQRFVLSSVILPVSQLLRMWSEETSLPVLTEQNYNSILPEYAQEMLTLLNMRYTTYGSPFFLTLLVSLRSLIKERTDDLTDVDFDTILNNNIQLADFILGVMVDAGISSEFETLNSHQMKYVFKALVKGMLTSSDPVEQMGYSLLASNVDQEEFFHQVIPSSCLAESTDDCGVCTMNLNKLHLVSCTAICATTKQRCNRLAFDQSGLFCRQHFAKRNSLKRSRTYMMNYNSTTPIIAADINADSYDDRSKATFHKQTLRVLHPMSKFKQSLDRKVPNGLYMPVYRVSNLYHTHDSKYCGKFYFFEPDSKVYLSIGKTKFFANKVDAYAHLYTEYSKLVPTHEVQVYGTPVTVIKSPPYTSRSLQGFAHGRFKMARIVAFLLRSYLDGNYLPDVVLILLSFAPWNVATYVTGHHAYTYKNILERVMFICDHFLRVVPDEQALDMAKPAIGVSFEEARKAGLADVPQEGTPWKDIPATPTYVSPFYPSVNNFPDQEIMIGQLDDLDGPICNMAQKLGYDTIIFQHEIGSRDAVTEILDVRRNAPEYENTWEINDVLSKPVIPTKFPKVFFPQTSYVTKVDGTKQYQTLLSV